MSVYPETKPREENEERRRNEMLKNEVRCSTFECESCLQTVEGPFGRRIKKCRKLGLKVSLG